MENYVLVVAEKPDAARKIASALGRTSSNNLDKTFFEVHQAFDGKSYIVCSAMGHLYEIMDNCEQRSVFPVFDVDWFPKAKTGRTTFKFHLKVAKRLRLIAGLASKASGFVNACDFDLEGETIGTNIIEFARIDPGVIMRPRFSTLVEHDIRISFSSMKTQERSLPCAGRFRHELDFLWGVNFSRSLTELATRSNGTFSNVTIGRVQGPTLAFVVQRELENQTHIPVPSWNVVCSLKTCDTLLLARYSHSHISTEMEANTIYVAVSRSKFAVATSVQSFASKQPPRYPFDLGELQREAFYFFHLSPSTTLRIAEKLYLSALISYPRTESQKLPPSIQPLNILGSVGKSQEYSNLVRSLFSEPSMRKIPWQGPRVDPAHPAIFPTGTMPKYPLAEDEKKLFDMIVRRFCNTFAPDSVTEKRRTLFDIASYEFYSEEERLMEEGWMKYYSFRNKSVGEFTNSFTVGEKLLIDSTKCEVHYSRAPARYNEGSLLAKMEDEGLGTKATRAEVISTIANRGYVSRSKLIPTDNALNLVFALKDQCSEMVSSHTTRELENKLQLIQEKEDAAESVLVESLTEIRNSLRKLRHLDRFQWMTDIHSAQVKQPLGDCPSCKTGQLYAIRSFRTKKRFIRCGNSKCRASSPLPPRGSIGRTKMTCPKCGWPVITIAFGSQKKGEHACSNFSCKMVQGVRNQV